MRQGLDISELEASTKIRAKYLRALENDEFSMLPGSTYVKSFLRTYAEHLGLDAQLLVEEYRAQHEPRGEGEVQAYVIDRGYTIPIFEEPQAFAASPKVKDFAFEAVGRPSFYNVWIAK